jgi:hypothetical protein
VDDVLWFLGALLWAACIFGVIAILAAILFTSDRGKK